MDFMGDFWTFMIEFFVNFEKKIMILLYIRASKTIYVFFKKNFFAKKLFGGFLGRRGFGPPWLRT